MTNKTREQEVWKIFLDYPFIEVSNLGRVRTKDRIATDRNGKKYHIKGRVLKQWDNGTGYMQVHFNVNGKEVHLYVHRIVAICFILNHNHYPEVNHIDCDPANNRWDNLEWCNHQENIAYRDKLGRWVNNNPGRPVIAIDLNDFNVFWLESQCEAARQLGVYTSNIYKVIKGKLNKTGGYWFCNADKNAVEKAREKFGDEIAEKVEKLMRKRKII